MKHFIDKIEMEGNQINLVDPKQDNPVRIVENDNGDLFISVEGQGFIVVDSKLFLGALKAMTTLNERERINSSRRCSTCMR